MKNNNVWLGIKHPPVRKEGSKTDVEIQTKDGRIQFGTFREYEFSSEWLDGAWNSIPEYEIVQWRLPESGSYNKHELSMIVASQQKDIEGIHGAMMDMADLLNKSVEASKEQVDMHKALNERLGKSLTVQAIEGLTALVSSCMTNTALCMTAMEILTDRVEKSGARLDSQQAQIDKMDLLLDEYRGRLTILENFMHHKP